MSTDELLKRLRPIMEEWPAGSIVWHRACGRRGVIMEHCLDASGCVMLSVSFEANSNWDKCLPICLSGSKISDGTDGDEWKDGDGKEGAGV